VGNVEQTNDVSTDFLPNVEQSADVDNSIDLPNCSAFDCNFRVDCGLAKFVSGELTVSHHVVLLPPGARRDQA
jgi:hypothetical protein